MPKIFWSITYTANYSQQIVFNESSKRFILIIGDNNIRKVSLYGNVFQLPDGRLDFRFYRFLANPSIKIKCQSFIVVNKIVNFNRLTILDQQ